MEANDLQAFLVGAQYPATKEELLAQASAQNLGPEALRRLERLPNREFDTAADVGFALSHEVVHRETR